MCVLSVCVFSVCVCVCVLTDFTLGSSEAWWTLTQVVRGVHSLLTRSPIITARHITRYRERDERGRDERGREERSEKEFERMRGGKRDEWEKGKDMVK